MPGSERDAAVPLHRPRLVAAGLFERVVELPESLVHGLGELLTPLLLVTALLGELDVAEIDVDAPAELALPDDSVIPLIVSHHPPTTAAPA